MESDATWLWRLGVIAVIGLLAWLVRNAYQTIHKRIDRLDDTLGAHITEDRERFDRVLVELGQVKGKLDILIGRSDASG